MDGWVHGGVDRSCRDCRILGGGREVSGWRWSWERAVSAVGKFNERLALAAPIEDDSPDG